MSKIETEAMKRINKSVKKERETHLREKMHGGG